jgi:glycerol-3-phosphate cytidylyltransferase|tara:strand:+ start:1575 stop:2015 length:441 start_codon:yes stop_codon:yes gene_type:complete
LKVGITFSTFDLFHAGHVIMLKEAKQHCDHLIVALQTDPTIDRPDTKNHPIQSLFERYEQLLACRYVDQIIPYERESEVLDILLSYSIDVRLIGEEYKNQEFSGKEICQQKNIEIIYNSRKHSFSTTELRNRIVEKETNFMRSKRI